MITSREIADVIGTVLMAWFIVALKVLVAVVTVAAAVISSLAVLFGRADQAGTTAVYRYRAPTPLVREIEYYAEYGALAYDTGSLDRLEFCRDLCERFGKGRARATLVHMRESNEVIIGVGGYLRGRAAYGKAWSPMTDVPGVRVHDFAQRTAEELLELISNGLDKIPRRKATRLVLVGHSLGGAIATLLAPLLEKQHGLKAAQIRVFTFNQPRVGDQAFAKYYDWQGFNFTRVVNKDDPVADYPPEEDGWFHVQREVWVNRIDSYLLCKRSRSQDPKCSKGKADPRAIRNHTYLAEKDVFRNARHFQEL